MKILYVSGSPRKNGNTMRIYHELTKQIKPPFEIEKIDLSMYQLNGCLGCNHCQTQIETIGCVQQDDIAMLLHKIIQADVILYASPLYGHSYSGQLKLFLDRHVALFKFIAGGDQAVDHMEILSFIKDKPVGLIVCCQGPIENNTELIQLQFEKFCESSLTKPIGSYLFPFCQQDSQQSHLSNQTLNQIIDDLNHLLPEKKK